MQEHEDNLERLISRSLDGELSSDEQLELDRELIRDPRARRLMEDYRELDARSRNALGAMADGQFTLRPHAAGPLIPLRRGWRVRAFWLAPGAIAAALLALLVPRPAFEGTPPPQPMSYPAEFGPLTDAPADGMYRPVSSTLPSVQRATGRDLVGVVGEDGNVYWIEVERTRTVRLPHGKSGAPANRL